MSECEHLENLNKSQINEGDLYTHHSGKKYLVLDVGRFRCANTGEYLIAYQEFDEIESPVWMHTVSQFTHKYDDGTPRFELTLSN